MPYKKPPPPPPLEYPVPTLTGYGHPAMADGLLTQGVASGAVGISGADSRAAMNRAFPGGAASGAFTPSPGILLDENGLILLDENDLPLYDET